MKLVIIGNGVAGVTTARFVAERDPSVDITIYTDECYPYYPRPRLIDLLAGQVARKTCLSIPWNGTKNVTFARSLTVPFAAGA